MEDPPLSIPNREVKLHSADGTARWWESRLAPNSESLTRDRRAFLMFVFEVLLFGGIDVYGTG